MASMALLALSVSPAPISSCSAVHVAGAGAVNASSGRVLCGLVCAVCGMDSYSIDAVIGIVRAQYDFRDKTGKGWYSREENRG